MNVRMLRLAAIPLGGAMVLGAVVAVAVGGPERGAGVAQGPPSLTPTPSETPSPTPSETPSPTATAIANTAPPTTSAPPTTTPPPPAPVKCGTRLHSATSDGVVSGTVLDSAGRPLKGIAIYSPVACGGHDPRSGVNRTDAAGRFALPCSSKAPSWVVAAPFEWWTRRPTTSAPVGFGWLTTPYAAVPCGTSYAVTLQPAATIRAQLVDATGKPVARTYSFTLFIGESERSRTDSAEGMGVVSPDARGLMTVTGLAPGTYHLLSSGASPPGDPATEMRATVKVAAGGTTTVQIVVKDAPPSPTPTATPTPTVTPGPDMPVVG